MKDSKLRKADKEKAIALKYAIQQGIESSIAHEYNPEEHLKSLKERK